MRTHVLALAAATATALATTAPLPSYAQSGSPLGSLFSCDNPGPNNRAGAIVGGLTGALVGSQVSKHERGLGAVLGAGLGAAAGNYIGCRMNTSSRTRAEGAVQAALDTGSPTSWYDPRTGASGRVEVISNGPAPYAGGYSQPVAATDLRYARGVQRIYSDFRPAAPAYVAPGRVNVRAAPAVDAPVVNRLRPGQEIRVAGLVGDGWLAVAEDGWVQGYVSASAVRPSGGMTYARSNVDTPYGCRMVQQTISMRGYQSESQRFNACRDASGQWRLNPA